MPFCRVQVFIMAARSRWSPENRYCRETIGGHFKHTNTHRVRNQTISHKRIKLVPDWLNIYSQRSWTPVSRCNSIHYGWSLPPNTSRERNHKLNLQFLQQHMLHLLTTVMWPTKQWNSLLQLKTKLRLMLINVYFKHIHTDSLCYENKRKHSTNVDIKAWLNAL